MSKMWDHELPESMQLFVARVHSTVVAKQK